MDFPYLLPVLLPQFMPLSLATLSKTPLNSAASSGTPAGSIPQGMQPGSVKRLVSLFFSSTSLPENKGVTLCLGSHFSGVIYEKPCLKMSLNVLKKYIPLWILGEAALKLSGHFIRNT